MSTCIYRSTLSSFTNASGEAYMGMTRELMDNFRWKSVTYSWAVMKDAKYICFYY